MDRASSNPSSPKSVFRRSDVRWRLAPWLVLATAAAVRLPQIASVGVRYDDGAAYAADARLWHRCVRFLADPDARAALVGGDDAALEAARIHHGIDFGDRYPKPCQGFTFLVASMMFVLGEHPDVVLIVNAMLSVLSVLMLYRFVLLWGDRPAALLAAMLLAIAPYHVVYARTALVESTAGFFALVGVWMWARARMSKRGTARAYCLSGLALGYACTCHYRCGYVVVAVVLYKCVALVALWRRSGEGRSSLGLRLRYGLWMGAGVLAPAIAIETVFRVARYSAAALGHELPLATYWEGLRYWLDLVSSQVRATGGTAVQWSAMGAYTSYVAHWQGAIFVGLAGFGAFLGLRRAGPARIALVLILVAIAVHATQPFMVARGPSAVVPFLCLLAGVGCAVSWRWSGRHRRIVRSGVVGLYLLAVMPAAKRSSDLLAQRSDIPAAARFVRQHGGAVAGPTVGKYALYLDEASIETVGLDKLAEDHQPGETLALLREMGVRWVITDPQYWSFPEHGRHFAWWSEFNRLVDETCTPAAWFPHISDYRWAFLAEGGCLDRLDAMRQTGVGPIRIHLVPPPDIGSTLAATVREAGDPDHHPARSTPHVR
jgi:hypothetical protein